MEKHKFIKVKDKVSKFKCDYKKRLSLWSFYSYFLFEYSAVDLAIYYYLHLFIYSKNGFITVMLKHSIWYTESEMLASPIGQQFVHHILIEKIWCLLCFDI